MNNRHLLNDIIARQYNEKWRFPDYDRAIKKLECHHRHSFLSCHPNNQEGIIYDYDVPVYICKFSPSKRDGVILAVANENGTVCIENTSKKRMRTYVQTHNNTVFDLAWMPGETQFVTVSGDHSAKLWDCGESDVKIVSEFLGHTRSVKCVHFKPENTSVFATGSRDGSLILWDARCSRKCAKVPMAHTPDQIIPAAAGTSPYVPRRKYYPLEASQSNSVTGLIFQNDNTLISSGSSDQFIRVWDMRKTYSRCGTMPLPKYQLLAPSSGFSHICINPEGTKMYANSMDSYIYCFNINSYQPDPISAYYGHQNGSFYVKSSMSHDGLYLLSGSTDKYAYIWNTRNAELSEVAIRPVVALPGHTAEVACVAMSSAGNIKIATCSDDGTYRLWYTHNVERKKDRCEVVETADVDDCGSTTSVRTEWKNKRKRGPVDDSTNSIKKDVHCTYHSKICRYYSNNLSAVTCRCQRQDNLGVKRPLEENDEKEANAPDHSKRRIEMEMQERTPPRSNEIKTVNRSTLHDLKSPKKPIKITLKRKLADLPNFADENEFKRKAHDRALLPLYSMNNGESELNGVGVMSELRETEFGDMINTEFSSKAVERKPEDENKVSDELVEGSIFSSPTTNLPNYVHDGTSPYIHRCPKTQKENKDWLTKLRKNKLDVDKTDDKSEASPKVAAAKMLIPGKRKLKRSASSEEKNPTLHKYFKISSKQAEVGYISQEVQKKTC